MTKVSACIDVSDKNKAIKFYTEGLGLELVKDSNGYVELSSEGLSIYLGEKAAGTNPLSEGAAGTAERNYDRHWTPVHLDFHVSNVAECVDKILALGGKKEDFKSGDWGSVAICADPFGNGFCVLQTNS